MRSDRRHIEEKEIRLGKNLDEKVEKKLKKDAQKAEKRKNSKFRNSAFGKKWFALKRWQRVLIYVAIAIVLLALIGFLTVYGMYSKMQNKVDEGNLGITTNIEDKYGETEIFNIALFGVDTRDENSFKGRSDTIMIASVDRSTGSIKLTSILRDSYVAIDGHKNQKITHAYMFGGPELAIKTINQNYHMNITDYATVNFSKLAEAIDFICDAVGEGIEVDITERERLHINDIGDDEGGSFPYIKQSGHVELNGKQAVVYARIRKLDSDNKRVERQKQVLEQVIQKAKKISPAKYGEMVKVGMSLCETSLSFTEIMSFAPMLSKEITLSTRVIPAEPESPIGGNYEGAWVWRYDLDLAADHIHEFIYGEAPAPDSIKTDKTSDDKQDKPQKNDKDKSNSSSNTNKKPSKPSNSHNSSKPHNSATTTTPSVTESKTDPTTTEPPKPEKPTDKPVEPTSPKPEKPTEAPKPDPSENVANKA